MDAIERRSVLRGILYVTAAAGLAASSLPAVVEAMPLAPQKDLVAPAVDEVSPVAAVVGDRVASALRFYGRVMP